ncbi:hypothetical protein DFJ67_1406 [Asanoa ferruginea]|uniref:Uncharacterized protein n=1 Tax=Asanoa ferruginea TaxID=53367 RepID=A0A3D9ZDH0_9ACTN|nr:hypothetical protein DFJ67_1406 [Asanoa ferruginea]
MPADVGRVGAVGQIEAKTVCPRRRGPQPSILHPRDPTHGGEDGVDIEPVRPLLLDNGRIRPAQMGGDPRELRRVGRRVRGRFRNGRHIRLGRHPLRQPRQLVEHVVDYGSWLTGRPTRRLASKAAAGSFGGEPRGLRSKSASCRVYVGRAVAVWPRLRRKPGRDLTASGLAGSRATAPRLVAAGARGVVVAAVQPKRRPGRRLVLSRLAGAAGCGRRRPHGGAAAREVYRPVGAGRRFHGRHAVAAARERAGQRRGLGCDRVVAAREGPGQPARGGRLFARGVGRKAAGETGGAPVDHREAARSGALDTVVGLFRPGLRRHGLQARVSAGESGMATGQEPTLITGRPGTAADVARQRVARRRLIGRLERPPVG